MATHKLQLLHREHGHVEATWDPAVTTEEGTAAIEEAERIFDEHRAKGFYAAATDPATKNGEMITKFDPNAETIVLFPQMAGG